ncbi:MAG TPA: hypothetical protein VF121_17505 [Thermoanaerobaculia bacterium]|nr:hypothetical protein [Thermoanaerobaculia bacterium]
MPNRILPVLIGDLDILATNLKGRLAELQHLAPLQAELEAWLTEVRGLESQQDQFIARLRETNEKRRLAESRGVDLRSRLAHGLRSHFGVKNKALHEFGIKPLVPPVRPAQKPQPPATTPPPVASGSSV